MSNSERKRLSYSEYLHIPELLKLQAQQSEEHDELQFIIVHQVYELWFKLVLHEVEHATQRLLQNRIPPANQTLQRVLEILRLLVQQTGVLESMSPWEFHKFRAFLAPGSGFQSEQFRRLEIASGLRTEEYLKAAVDMHHQYLRAELDRPSLNEALRHVLRTLDPDPQEALMKVYVERDAHADLYQLAEALVNYDELIQKWRFHHALMAERMIGRGVIGTGGSSGVAYLEGTVGRRFFPDLWAIRIRLAQKADSVY